MKNYTKLTLSRPNGPTEKQIAKWAIHPRIRSRLSTALRRPIFPGMVYISHNGRYVHIRLSSPKAFDKRSFRMKDLGQNGTRGIIGCPAGQYDPETNSCRVATKLQAVLIPKERVTALGKQINKLSAPKRHKRYKRNGTGMSFEHNPLLMTVMNPGPEYGFKPNPVDVEYNPSEQMFKVHRSNPGAGYHSNPMNPLDADEREWLESRAKRLREAADIDDVHTRFSSANENRARAGEDELINGALGKVVFNDNPRHDEDEDSSGEFGYGWCKLCSGPLMSLGRSGDIVHLRCRNCSADQSRKAKPSDPTPFENNKKHYCDNPGTCGDQSHGFQDNPNHHSQYKYDVGDMVKNKKRLVVGGDIMLSAETSGVIIGKGKIMGKAAYEIKFSGRQGSRTFRLFEDEIKGSGYRKNMSRKARKFRDNKYPPHYKPHGAPVTGKRVVRGTPAGGEFFDRKGQVTNLRKEPNARGGRVGKSTIKGRKIPIQKFMAWLRKSGTPDEWRRFMKEVAAYKKFHKGAEPKFITRKLVDVGAGKKVVARAFGYSMGKSPFEPYITPTGSGKGNKTPYLHEYETLPDGITNSTGKVVIKPLEGRTKITDWIHY